MSLRILGAALVVLFVSLVVAVPARALAHESRDVGKYQFVVGFLVEPAYEGQKNGLDLRVRVPVAPGATGTPTPVMGLEKTLQVEMSFVGNDKKVTKPVRAISASSDPGHYTADLLPTQPGQYAFRIFGTIEGTNVNETFTSGDKFANVGKADDINFPDPLPQIRSVQGTATDAQVTAEDAAKAASTARLFAIAAIGVAAVAIGVAFRATMVKK